MHSSLAEKLKYKERIGNAFCVHTYAIYCNFTGVKIEFPYENLWVRDGTTVLKRFCRVFTILVYYKDMINCTSL